ncbi:unnamed protein product [Polarella glacialis]|uniref:U-box domain-containing protein n=1 Tax=Polarella glacialis TaxID=89957 RepID=A0A813E9W9_POLGL|nr:unnamed protein product [Polarella glacialis]
MSDAGICPITGECMTDPVIDRCGHSFERTAILRWLLQHGRHTCPVGREPLEIEDLIPNLALRDMLSDREQNRFRLEFSYSPDNYGSIELSMPYTLQVMITNLGKAALTEDVIELLQDSYHEHCSMAVPAVAGMQKTSLMFSVSVRGRRLAQDLPERFQLKYGGMKIGCRTDMTLFTGSVCHRRPKHTRKFNVLVYGLGGAGKSSLICKFASLLSDECRPDVSFAPVGAGDRHVTKRLVRYALPGTNIDIWDTWGFSGENYQDNTLSHIFEGRLPSNWQMSDMIAARCKDLAHGESTKHERRSHAAILVIEYNWLKSMECADSVRAQFRHFTGLAPVIVVNKIDQAAVSWRDPDSGFKLEKLRKEVAEVCQVNPNSVFLNVNYVIETARDPLLDRQALMILDEVVARAARFEAQHGSPTAVLPHDSKTGSETTAYEW